MIFTFENNTFASECCGRSIYLGRLKTNEEIVVKGNIFETKASVDTVVYVQCDSGYTPMFADTDNTFAE